MVTATQYNGKCMSILYSDSEQCTTVGVLRDLHSTVEMA